MLPILSAFVSGLLFGLGLIVSQMVNPAKVLGFLHVFGAWDPSLAFVMAGAIATAALGYAIVNRRGMPVIAASLTIPTRRDTDSSLVGGAALFGVGWGLVGLCPGPALTVVAFEPWPVLVFVAAMVAGMALFRLLSADRPRRAFHRAPDRMPDDV
jgi:uncharacterized membrane protein YedE/YeeE